MTQLTPSGLIRILGHVSAIMVIPMVGGAVAGLILDGWLGTSPISVLSGFAVGNAVAFTGIWLYIRAHSRRSAGAGERTNGA